MKFLHAKFIINLNNGGGILSENQRRLSNLLDSSKELKPVMDIEGLLLHLEDLNLIATNKVEISAILMNKGYFKFSGYRKIFLTTYTDDKWTGKYEYNVTTDNVISLMQLDSDLSKLFFEYISIIEMKIKSRAAYFISKEFGCVAYLNKDIFTCEDKWENFMLNRYFKTLDKEKMNHDPIVIHHIRHYDSKLPIWALFDKISFDTFIFFLQSLKQEVKEKIFSDIFCSSKTYYNIERYGYIKAYPQYLTIVKFMRNRVCHHDRIIDYKHKYSPATNKFKSNFIETFEGNNMNCLYLTDIVKLMGCFLNCEEYVVFRRKYCERINRTINDLPLRYKNRLIEILGYQSIKV